MAAATDCTSLQGTPPPKSILLVLLLPSLSVKLILSSWLRSPLLSSPLSPYADKCCIKKENIPGIIKRGNLHDSWLTFHQVSAAGVCACPLRGKPAPRQESNYSCVHLCQSLFVRISSSPSLRYKPPLLKCCVTERRRPEKLFTQPAGNRMFQHEFGSGAAMPHMVQTVSIMSWTRK